MIVPTLDLDWLRAFVTATDTQSFTAAGRALGATQSAISIRIRKLEERVGQRLLERNPRTVVLTREGEALLPDARRLLDLHDDAALRAMGGKHRTTFELGVSDHAAGHLLPDLLAPLTRVAGDLRMSVTVGMSQSLLAQFDAGEFDAVIGRSDEMSADSETLVTDRLVWVAADGFQWSPPDPLPFVSLAAPCGIRETALNALTSHGVSWRATFTGTGVAAIQAAVVAGLGVACLEARNAPWACRIVKHKGLPKLPSTRTVIRFRRDGRRLDPLVRAIVAAFRGAGPAGASASRQAGGTRVAGTPGRGGGLRT